MNMISVILLNIVYGTLFFLAFGVLIGTVVLFCMAFWDKIGRDLFHRTLGS